MVHCFIHYAMRMLPEIFVLLLKYVSLIKGSNKYFIDDPAFSVIWDHNQDVLDKNKHIS